jgi:hypothetical protein
MSPDCPRMHDGWVGEQEIPLRLAATGLYWRDTKLAKEN